MKKFFAASFVVALAACSTPEEVAWSVADGAYERTSATTTQKGEVTENNQLEMKIYSGGRCCCGNRYAFQFERFYGC